ncbi:MAG: arylesterase [Saprospiraceae bacterium]|nr:MAG: arylesterase [Saprospiraceae bacterium]
MQLKNLIWVCQTALLFSCQPASQPIGGKTPESKTANSAQEKSAPQTKNIVFFGNSLTAAYRLDPSQGFVYLLQQRLDSLGLPYKTINAGLSGETTAAGLARLPWVIRQPVDIFVLELGGNDALRGIAPATSFDNLNAIITAVKTKYPTAKIVIAGMMAPPNLGPDYTAAFNEMYPRLAKKHKATLIPFLLENVGGIPKLNLSDGIHPNEEGQKIVEENVWNELKKLVVEN